MIKVLFDHQIFSEQTYGGISRYFANINNTITTLNNIKSEIGILYTNNHYLKDYPAPLNNAAGRLLLKSQKKCYKWNKRYSRYLIANGKYDVLHPTYYNPYFLKYNNKPLVITVHDMTYEALPQYFTAFDPLTHFKRLLVEKADKIIAISNTTKNDLIKYLNVEEHKIEVIYHGIDLSQSADKAVPALPENYILFVGARYSYKNFYMLVDAFKILSDKYPDLHLVLAGGGQLGQGETEYLLRNGIINKTMQISASDEELNTLYKKTQCFIYPSLYEGFGLPILEAFKNNCPVLLSNCSCFEEIAGQDAARYFDHESLQSLVEGIEIIITNPGIKERMTKAGSKKMLEYSMENCVNKTIELYKTIAYV